MSAFMCGRSHVCTIAQFAVDRKILPRVFPTAATFANEMLRENARSMDARYDDRWHGDGDYPPPVLADDDEVLQWARQEFMAPVAIAKLISCLDYQSCETDDWEETQTFKALRSIQLSLLRHLPGYDGAPWGIDDQRTNVVSLSSMVKAARR